MPNSKFIETLFLKGKVKSDRERCLKSTSGLHIYLNRRNPPAGVHIHTHTQGERESEREVNSSYILHLFSVPTIYKAFPIL